MSARYETKEKNTKTDDDLILIEIHGRDSEIWEKAKKPFFSRILERFRAIKKSKIPGHGELGEKVENSVFKAVRGVDALLDKQHIENAERQANIALKLAEIRKTEAETRKITAEAECTEFELAQRRVMAIQNAQAELGKLISEGKIAIINNDGIPIIALLDNIEDPQ